MKKMALVLATAVVFLHSCTSRKDRIELFGGVWYTDMQGVNINGRDMLVPADDHNGCGVTSLTFYADGTLIETTYEDVLGRCNTRNVRGNWDTYGTALTIHFSDDPYNPHSYFIVKLSNDQLRLESPNDRPGTINVSIYTREY